MNPTDWAAIASITGAVLMCLLRTYDRWAHRRAIMSATPDQRAALEKMPVPSPLLDRGGPALLLLALGTALALWPRLQEYRVERILERAGAARWAYSGCQPGSIGDFNADLRPDGLPVYRLARGR
ncbi:MAG: hypothetical protein E6R03_13935 [Hyphomicrobiaceae bacterium]|nr:MAG: hypothetical protein E6R03_13935 [Hyphomicrobiaceae bacterium]